MLSGSYQFATEDNRRPGLFLYKSVVSSAMTEKILIVIRLTKQLADPDQVSAECFKCNPQCCLCVQSVQVKKVFTEQHRQVSSFPVK